MQDITVNRPENRRIVLWTFSENDSASEAIMIEITPVAWFFSRSVETTTGEDFKTTVFEMISAIPTARELEQLLAVLRQSKLNGRLKETNLNPYNFVISGLYSIVNGHVGIPSDDANAYEVDPVHATV